MNLHLKRNVTFHCTCNSPPRELANGRAQSMLTDQIDQIHDGVS